MDELQTAARKLVEVLDTRTDMDRVRPGLPGIRVATVVARTVNGVGVNDTVSIQLAGDTTTISGVYFYRHYAPVVGDVVDVLQVGATLRVLGTLQASREWTPLTLNTNFTNYGNGYLPAAYYVDNAGFVHLRGLILVGSSAPAQGNIVTTLPVSLRPVAASLHIIATSATTGAGRIDVRADGQLMFFLPGIPAANGFFSLDGITFRPAIG